MTEEDPQKGEKRRRKKVIKRPRDLEQGWTKRRKEKKRSRDPERQNLEPRSRRRRWIIRNWTALTSAVVLILLIVGLVAMGWLRKEDDSNSAQNNVYLAPSEDADGIRERLDAAQSVALAFLKETDPSKRLKWVCNAEEVQTRLNEYSEEARVGIGEIEKMLGHQGDGANPITAFVVKFPSGNVRLIELVGTPDGPRVDWDAYARYGTASWGDLFSGRKEKALVRVFCEPSSERWPKSEDQDKWTSFRLSSPDLHQVALGFAEVGSVRETMMKKVILGSPNYRQRFVLEVVRHEGKDEAHFEITRCLAVGWIQGKQDLEALWQSELQPTGETEN